MNQPQVYTWLLRLEPPAPPPLAHQSTGFELSASYSQFPLAIQFIYDNVYVFNATLYSSTLEPHCVHTSVLCFCIFIAPLQIGSSVPSFQIPYACVNIKYFGFALIFFHFILSYSRFQAVLKWQKQLQQQEPADAQTSEGGHSSCMIRRMRIPREWVNPTAFSYPCPPRQTVWPQTNSCEGSYTSN